MHRANGPAANHAGKQPHQLPSLAARGNLQPLQRDTSLVPKATNTYVSGERGSMARLFLILVLLAAVVAFVVILHAIWTAIVQTTQQGLRPATGAREGTDMAPSGIQKAAYIALIVVLFGVAAGKLGGL